MKDDLQGCSDALDRIPLYVGGDLEADEREFVRAHLGDCPACAEREEIARAARSSLQTALRARETNRLDTDLWSGVRAGLVREGVLDAPQDQPHDHSGLQPAAALPGQAPERQRAGTLLRFAPRLALAASAAVVLIIAQLGGSDGPGPDDPLSSVENPTGPALVGAPEPAPAMVAGTGNAEAPQTTGGLRKVKPGERLLENAESLHIVPVEAPRVNDQGARLASDGYR